MNSVKTEVTSSLNSSRYLHHSLSSSAHLTDGRLKSAWIRKVRRSGSPRPGFGGRAGPVDNAHRTAHLKLAVIGVPSRFSSRPPPRHHPLRNRPTPWPSAGATSTISGELLAEPHLVAPILNILVLHTGQVPSVAGRPFFIVIGLASVISRVDLHFMR